MEINPSRIDMKIGLIAIGLIIVAVTGVLAAFLLFNPDQIASPEKIVEILIRVEYDGKLKCSYGDETVLVSFSSTQSRTVSLKNTAQINPWVISCNAQKLDNSSKTLKLMIMKTDGTILKENSTSAPYGLTQIIYSIQD